jgi:ABC-2 type transport system ATP-binding protein
VTDLVVERGGIDVVIDLAFEAAAGEVCGVLGPSGSGKTTVLRCVLGNQRIRRGTVTVLGHPAGSRPLRSVVGYASQAASVYPDLTVAENIRYFVDVLGVARSELERVLTAVNLGSYRDRLAGHLSGGQRSRVSLAVAMLGHPRLLVLDEPTVGLDPVLREELWQLFHQLAADGATLLVSSHVMDEAERCGSLLLLREGRLLAQGSPNELKSRAGAETMDAAFLNLIRSA